MDRNVKNVKAVRELYNLEECKENTDLNISSKDNQNCRGVHYTSVLQRTYLKNAGITLIALIITIIILLILAGVALHFTLGENGIIEKAKLAGEKYQNAANDEQNELNQISKYFRGDYSLGDNENTQNNIKEFTTNITDINSHGFTININTSTDESNIVCYTFIVNGDLKQSSSEKTCVVTDLNANTENEVIVVAMDNLGNSRKVITKHETKSEIVFTKEYLDQGQIGGNVTVTQNNYNGSDGLSITGNSSRPVGGEKNWDIYSINRWYREIDITDYNTLQFYAKKGQDHGSLYISIDNTDIYAVSYSEFSTTWVLYNVDLSGLEGKHVISIIGGYEDNTGNSNSNTQYCDIRLTTK